MNTSFLLVFVCGKCFLLITVNLVFLVLGILVSSGSTQTYGVVLKTETQEWSKNPIIDVIATNSSTCPQEHE